jgi:hypothetical protein
VPPVISRAAAVVAIVLLFLAVGAVHRLPLAVHVTGRQTVATERAAKNESADIIEKPHESLWAPSTWEPVTTLTVALAFFTMTLAGVSIFQAKYIIKADGTARISADAARKAAEAADLNAQAAIGVELPRLELHGIYINTLDSVLQQDALRAGMIRVEFFNHGRTTAHILEDCLVHTVPDFDFLAVKARYPFRSNRQATIGTVTSAQEIYPIDCKTRIILSDEDAESIIQGEKTLWIYGYVKYRDFLEGIWITKFCVTLSRERNIFRFRESSLYPDYTGRQRYNTEVQTFISKI